MILRARTLVPMCGPPLEDAAVVVREGRVADCGPVREIEARHGPADLDLGEQVLLPGLINAHCHLDYTMMRKSIRAPKSFADWVQRINALKRTLDLDDYRKAVEDGLSEARHWGTTSLLNIESYPELLVRLAPPAIRVWWYYEMIDLRLRLPTDELIAGALAFFDGREGWLGGFGLSPHAPYTASEGLYRLSRECAEKTGMPVTTHLAESREETAMFRERSGPLFHFLESLGRDMSDCGEQSAFGRLSDHGALDPGTLFAHMNELSDDDFARLGGPPWRDRLQVAHCPRSHAYFGHAPFPYRRLCATGATVSLGTDSLASCDSLNLFAEMRHFRDTHPDLPAREILAMVTLHPARALRLDGELGRIAPGALADLIALPFTGNAAGVYNSVLAHEDPVRWLMVHGQILTD